MSRKAVAIIVNWEEKILVAKKNNDTGGFLAGKWHIPGETLKEGESDIDALIRGLKEEAGIKKADIRLIRYLGCGKSPRGTKVNWYICVPRLLAKIKIRAGSDVSEVKWMPRKEIKTILEICTPEGVACWPKEVHKYFSTAPKE